MIKTDEKQLKTNSQGVRAKIRRFFSTSASWLLPLGALIIMLWFEAEIPGLPSFTQGVQLSLALGDSSQGQGFSGLFSLHALLDVSYRLAAVLTALAGAWFLARYVPGGWIRLYQNTVYRVRNIRRRNFGLLLFLLAFSISLGYFGLVRGFTPRLGDEIAYLFQARLFSQGQLWMPAPQLAEFFDTLLIVDGARWFSQYPPGHPLFLTPGVALGMPWIIGPMMGGVTAIAIWLLGTRLYDERTGRLAGIFTLISPYFWYMSGSYLSHSTCLAMGSLSALGLMTAFQETGRWSLLPALGGGTALGAAALIRPLTAIGLALGLGLLALIGTSTINGLAPRIRRVAAIMPLFVAAAIAVAALVPLYNLMTTGHPLKWGYQLANPYPHELGFGRRGHQDIDYTPARALFNTRVRYRWLDGGFLAGRSPIPGGGFFFWPFPAIAVALAILARGKPTPTDVALGFVIVNLAAAYFFYYFLEICWGPRFIYESSFALLLLTARGVIALGETAVRCGWENSRSPGANSSSAFAAAFLIPAVFIAVFHVSLPTGETREKLYDPITWPTRSVDVALTRALQQAEISQGLVFLKNAGGFYETAWRRMFVDQDRKIIFAKDLGEANQNLIAAHGAPYWVATYNNDPYNPKFSIRHAVQGIWEEKSAAVK